MYPKPAALPTEAVGFSEQTLKPQPEEVIASLDPLPEPEIIFQNVSASLNPLPEPETRPAEVLLPGNENVPEPMPKSDPMAVNEWRPDVKLDDLVVVVGGRRGPHDIHTSAQMYSIR